MKHKILVILAVIAFILLDIVIVVYTQDTVRIKHINYTTVYSKSLHYPVLVEWWETRQGDWCSTKLPRKDQFQPDPLLKYDTNLENDYVFIDKYHKVHGLKGLDRGHMCPANANECLGSQVLTECFYFSNMAPQYHALNAGDWKSVEELTAKLTKQYDSVYVWAGSVGAAEKYRGTAIPTQCWKVLYIKRTKEYEAFLFDNKDEKQVGVNAHKVDIEDIKKLTGFKFNL